MSPDVISVKALPNFELVAEFDTGEKRRFDMRPYLDYPAFVTLKDENLFMRARAEQGTVVWTEDIDLSPDTLYLRGHVC
jgi:hypothetical protein